MFLINYGNIDRMESFQRNSKYSAKEFVKLNAIIDAMRLELTKERLDRYLIQMTILLFL